MGALLDAARGDRRETLRFVRSAREFPSARRRCSAYERDSLGQRRPGLLEPGDGDYWPTSRYSLCMRLTTNQKRSRCSPADGSAPRNRHRASGPGQQGRLPGGRRWRR
jgi:hypothetical protein